MVTKVTSDSTVSTVGSNNDIFTIAGNISYKIVLSVKDGDIVAEMKGTRVAPKK